MFGESVRGWSLRLYPEAGEAGGAWSSGPASAGFVRDLDEGPAEPDVGRSEVEAARRARGKLRRYCAANGLNRLGTLTYSGAGNHDPRQLRADLAGFFRRLRADVGDRSFPYVWVPEWHKTDHGLHAHFAVGDFVHRRRIEAAWGRGFVHIKLIGDLPVGSGRFEEARKAAGYLAKYVGKAFDERRVQGLHRYEVAEGFQPASVMLRDRTRAGVLDLASEHMGRRPTYVWVSSDVADWMAPPAVWASWD